MKTWQQNKRKTSKSKIYFGARCGNDQRSQHYLQCKRASDCDASKEFTQIFPQPSWVEHNAEEIWEAQLCCIKEALRETALSPEEIAVIGIANQRETTVVGIASRANRSITPLSGSAEGRMKCAGIEKYPRFRRDCPQDYGTAD
jgi:hypothetical protein